MIITIDNALHIPLVQLRPDVAEEIKQKLTIKNPAYAEALGMLRASGRKGKPYGVPEFIRGWGTHQGQLIVPRGCTRDIQMLLAERGIPFTIDNRTRRLPEVDFTFNGILKPAQVPAVEAILARRLSTISSPTGSGKTVMGLYVIAARSQPALVIVHTTSLLNQWVERAMHFLGMAREEIGIIGQGQKKIGPRLTIALVQTLRKCSDWASPKIGHVIVDECHHQAASTYTEALSPFDCAFALGLSATHKRRDGLTPLIYWHVGPLVYEVSNAVLVRDGDIIQVEPVIRKTEFVPRPDYDPVWQRAALMQDLTTDYTRNVLICEDVAKEAQTGPCIVLTDRKAHAEALADRLIFHGIRAEACHGDITRPAQERIIEAMNNGNLRVLVATGQLLGEGFDCKRLTALFLASPIRFSGRLIQYLGRVARSAEGKTSARVYDYVDVHVEVLVRAAMERQRTYRKLSRQAKGPTPKGE